MLQVAFHAEHAGVYMAKVNIIASPVVTDESTLSGNEMHPNVVHIEGIAELPDIEVRHFSTGTKLLLFLEYCLHNVYKRLRIHNIFCHL